MVWTWLWLAAQKDSVEEKRRCLDAVLGLDPHDEAVLAALEKSSFKETPY